MVAIYLTRHIYLYRENALALKSSSSRGARSLPNVTPSRHGHTIAISVPVVHLPSPPSQMSSPRVLIYLLRRDLRLADNPIFNEVSKTFQQSQHPYTHFLPIYIFAAQQIEVSGFLSSESERSPYPAARSNVAGFWRCGPHRAKFLAESVWNLKRSLHNTGSGLEVRIGLAGQVIQGLLNAYKKQSVEVVAVYMTAEEGVEEKREEREVKEAAESAGTEFKLWTDEKYYVDDRDIPFRNPEDLPSVFTSYKKAVEPLREAPRRVLPSPSELPPLPPSIPSQPHPFIIPKTLEDTIANLHKPLDPSLGLSNPPTWPTKATSAHPFHGGETTGHERIHHLVNSGSMTAYKDTRNGMLGLDFSTSTYICVRVSSSESNVECVDISWEHSPSKPVSKLVVTPQTSKTDSGMMI